jgi:hypothetical protein
VSDYLNFLKINFHTINTDNKFKVFNLDNVKLILF